MSSLYKYLPTGTFHIRKREVRGMPEFYCGVEKRPTTMVLGGFIKTSLVYVSNKFVCEQCLNFHIANLENKEDGGE